MTRRNTIGFWNGPDGPVLRWRCECGQEGTLDRHGDHADPTGIVAPGDRPTPDAVNPSHDRDGSRELTV